MRVSMAWASSGLLRRAGFEVVAVESGDEALRHFTAEPDRFDLVVLDPPSFAKSKQSRYAAIRAYTRINALALRYSALAMVRGDSRFLHDALLLWMGTMLRGLGMAPQFIEDAYKAMERVASRELTPKTAELLPPFIQQCGRELSGAASS